MGLLYQMPTTEAEIIYTRHKGSEWPELRSYGLPLLFWGYFLAFLLVIAVMLLLAQEPIQKLIATGDSTNIFLAYLVHFSLWMIPFTGFLFFFYQKRLLKRAEHLRIEHRFFFIPFYWKNIQLKDTQAFELKPYLSTPNIAKINPQEGMQAFENRGYFELYAKDQKDQDILVDRHSQKYHLKKVLELLQRY